MEFAKKDYVAPARMIGNIYYVGTHPASTHVIDTGDGLILIDPGYYEALYVVIDNMHRVGLDPMDIKYIILTHAHYDHVDATAALVELTGAKVFISKDDMPLISGEIFHYPFRPFTPDVLISDGDVIELGNTSIKCISTPGHTDGTISIFFDVTEDGTTYRAGMFGGAGSNTMMREFLTENNLPDDCREKYVASVKRLLNEKVDIFLGNHVWNNKTKEKLAALGTTDVNPFIDPEGWTKFLERSLATAMDIIENDK